MIAGFIASGGESEGGISVSIGSYLGSTMLVTSFVCPMVIFFSTKEVKVLFFPYSDQANSFIHSLDAKESLSERYALPAPLLCIARNAQHRRRTQFNNVHHDDGHVRRLHSHRSHHGISPKG